MGLRGFASQLREARLGTAWCVAGFFFVPSLLLLRWMRNGMLDDILPTSVFVSSTDSWNRYQEAPCDGLGWLTHNHNARLRFPLENNLKWGVLHSVSAKYNWQIMGKTFEKL
ncbi:hypothetical protein NXS19_006799 [Fusarium pseudograminearum]|nr:hypothetical protein NXS19_006799 [Fusarium pseudograminearum]